MQCVHTYAVPDTDPKPAEVMNLYDFDGVLASPLEEALFQMPNTDHDMQFIRAVSEKFSLDLRQESFVSARYICIQAIMWQHQFPVGKGPVTPEADVPYYILTARSDRFAVRRMHRFIETVLRDHEPIKTQHLDHLPKGQAIEVLLERHPDTHFRFYDDNTRHILSARMLRSARVKVFHVDNHLDTMYGKAESFYRNTLLELAL